MYRRSWPMPWFHRSAPQTQQYVLPVPMKENESKLTEHTWYSDVLLPSPSGDYINNKKYQPPKIKSSKIYVPCLPNWPILPLVTKYPGQCPYGPSLLLATRPYHRPGNNNNIHRYMRWLISNKNLPSSTETKKAEHCGEYNPINRTTRQKKSTCVFCAFRSMSHLVRRARTEVAWPWDAAIMSAVHPSWNKKAKD